MNKQELMDVYYRLRLARRFEQRVAEQYTKGNIAGFCHLYQGEEAVALGAIWHMREGDYLIGAYRDHGYYLLRGGDPKKEMAELFGKREGCCKGKGGSMHLFDWDIKFMGGYAIVAGMCPLAVGLAQSIVSNGDDRVVVCFFGDGATNQGVYHEALNMAALYKLPVVWVCENNYYAIGTSVPRSSAKERLAEKAKAYDVPTYVVDGMDFFKMQSVSHRCIKRAREGKGPSFIEAKCYRYRGHSMADPARYRSEEEVEYWKSRDPIPKIKKTIQHDFPDTAEEEFKEVDERVEEEVEEAIEFAQNATDPPMEEIYADVFKE